MTILSIFSPVVLGLLCVNAVNAGPLGSRAVIPHTAVVGFPESVPTGIVGQVYEAYKPYLDVTSGCVPYPAVDAEGNTSGGLKNAGAENGDCTNSTGQVYVRGGQHGNYYGVMYAWYMPKDGGAHRHDWEGVIVWLNSGTSTSASNIVQVCPSAHGDWLCSTGYTLSGTSPLIKYYKNGLSHSCGLTNVIGVQQPMVSWETLPAAAQNALETTDFGSGVVPFNNAKFDNNLGKATF
ncbi:necrosis- and ethylene-inducing protein 2 precursor [Ilyonectria robusta]